MPQPNIQGYQPVPNHPYPGNKSFEPVGPVVQQPIGAGDQSKLIRIWPWAMRVFLSSISEWSISLEQKANLSSGFNRKTQIQRLNYHYYWFFYSNILTSVERFRNSIEWTFFHYHVIPVLTKDFFLRSQVNKIDSQMTVDCWC